MKLIGGWSGVVIDEDEVCVPFHIVSKKETH